MILFGLLLHRWLLNSPHCIAIVEFFWRAVELVTQFVEEHPEECKFAATTSILCVFAATIVWIAFPALHGICVAIGGCLRALAELVLQGMSVDPYYVLT